MKKFVTTVKLSKMLPTYVRHDLGTKDVLIQTYDLANESINVDLRILNSDIVEIEPNNIGMTIKVIIAG